VLVVLEGIHQEIPEGPLVADTHAVTLPLPPNEKGAESGGVEQVQTEADKVLGKYEALGKEENHVYGAVGSNLPNFNNRTPPSPVAGKPVDSSATPAAAVLPDTSKQTVTKQPADSDAPLPLGSPRRKPSAPIPPPQP
jgi:hypothetical protein